jgi:trimethylamine--corrinoid protein Co-methyltransferase
VALDLIDAVGPGGAYITSDHTLARFREALLVPKLVDRQHREAWVASGRPNMGSRAAERVQQILAEHQPEPLSSGVAARLDEIVREVEARAGRG